MARACAALACAGGGLLVASGAARAAGTFSWAPLDSPAVARGREVAARFDQESLFEISVEVNNAFALDNRRAIAVAEEELRRIPGVRRVFGPAQLADLAVDGRGRVSVRRVLERGGSEGDDEAVRQRVVRRADALGWFLAPDGSRVRFLIDVDPNLVARGAVARSDRARDRLVGAAAALRLGRARRRRRALARAQRRGRRAGARPVVAGACVLLALGAGSLAAATARAVGPRALSARTAAAGGRRRGRRRGRAADPVRGRAGARRGLARGGGRGGGGGRSASSAIGPATRRRAGAAAGAAAARGRDRARRRAGGRGGAAGAARAHRHAAVAPHAVPVRERARRLRAAGRAARGAPPGRLPARAARRRQRLVGRGSLLRDRARRRRREPRARVGGRDRRAARPGARRSGGGAGAGARPPRGAGRRALRRRSAGRSPAIYDRLERYLRTELRSALIEVDLADPHLPLATRLLGKGVLAGDARERIVRICARSGRPLNDGEIASVERFTRQAAMLPAADLDKLKLEIAAVLRDFLQGGARAAARSRSRAGERTRLADELGSRQRRREHRRPAPHAGGAPGRAARRGARDGARGGDAAAAGVCSPARRGSD